MFRWRVKSWAESLRGNVWHCWMEGLGYSYEDTLREHNIEEWNQEEWQEWYDAEKGYWQRVEAEPKRLWQVIRAVIRFAWTYPYTALWNFHSIFLLPLWWTFEKRVLRKDFAQRRKA